MASPNTAVAFFAACFAVLVMVVAAQSDDSYHWSPAPAPNASTTVLPYSTMATGFLALIVTFLVVIGARL